VLARATAAAYIKEAGLQTWRLCGSNWKSWTRLEINNWL